MLEELLYVDAAGIQRLFAQAGPTTPRKVIGEVSSANATSGKLTPNVGFSLFGVKIGGSGEFGRSYNRAAKLVQEADLGAENQLSVVRLALKHLGRLHTEIYSATNEAKATNGTAFCDFSGTFRPFGWKETDDEWRLRANQDNFLLLELEDDPTTKVGMGFSKIVFGGPLEQIFPTSHLALRLRRSISLRILGTIDAGRYVKPYAASFL